MTMTRDEFLSMREDLMTKIESIMDSNFGEVEYNDDVVGQLCDAVCETMDPAGLG